MALKLPPGLMNARGSHKGIAYDNTRISGAFIDLEISLTKP